MSKEPGMCDPYVKVYDELEVGMAMGAWGGGEGPCHWAESQSPSTPMGLGPFEVEVTDQCACHMGSRHLLGPVGRL